MRVVYREGLMDIPAHVARPIVGEVGAKRAYRQPRTSHRVKSIYKFTLTNPMEGDPHRLEIVVYRRGHQGRLVWAVRGSSRGCDLFKFFKVDGGYEGVAKHSAQA